MARWPTVLRGSALRASHLRMTVQFFSIRLHVIAAGLAHAGTDPAPVEPMLAADRAERLLDALLHAAQAADVHVGRVSAQLLCELVRSFAHASTQVHLWCHL